MKKVNIALFADAGSAQLAALNDVFKEKEVKTHTFDIQLGSANKPNIVVDKNRLIWDSIDFKDIRVAHIRCMAVNTPSTIPPVMNESNYSELRSVFLREQEFQAATRSFFNQMSLRSKLVINTLTRAYVDHDTKAQLYHKLHDAGFCVPDTIMTNSAEHAKTFFKKVGQAVAKPSIGIGSTRRVNSLDIERLGELNKSPVLFQELIEGDTIRVHIVGDKVVLALRIIGEEGQVDSRTNPQGFEYFKLPEMEEEKIVKATHSLGLNYAAWDILAAKDGRFAYLDCNPGPFILWIGIENTRAVFHRLADYMIRFAETGSLVDACAAVTPCDRSYSDMVI